MNQLKWLAIVSIAALTVVTEAQTEEVTSVNAKRRLCSAIADAFELKESDKAKLKATCPSKVTTAVGRVLRDQKTNILTGLADVKFSYNAEPLEIRGSALLIRSFTVDSNGRIRSRWEVRQFRVDSLSSGPVADTARLLNEVANAFDVHNGWTEVSHNPNYTKEMATGELESLLENVDEDGACAYETNSDSSTNLASLGHRDETGILTALNKKGRIQFALSRSWDQNSGDVEYCVSDYHILYTTDGYVLILAYD